MLKMIKMRALEGSQLPRCCRSMFGHGRPDDVGQGVCGTQTADTYYALLPGCIKALRSGPRRAQGPWWWMVSVLVARDLVTMATPYGHSDTTLIPFQTTWKSQAKRTYLTRFRISRITGWISRITVQICPIKWTWNVVPFGLVLFRRP